MSLTQFIVLLSITAAVIAAVVALIFWLLNERQAKHKAEVARDEALARIRDMERTLATEHGRYKLLQNRALMKTREADTLRELCKELRQMSANSMSEEALEEWINIELRRQF